MCIKCYLGRPISRHSKAPDIFFPRPLLKLALHLYEDIPSQNTLNSLVQTGPTTLQQPSIGFPIAYHTSALGYRYTSKNQPGPQTDVKPPNTIRVKQQDFGKFTRTHANTNYCQTSPGGTRRITTYTGTEVHQARPSEIQAVRVCSFCVTVMTHSVAAIAGCCVGLVLFAKRNTAK